MQNYLSHPTLDDYVINPMGMAVVDGNGKAQTYNSDNKAAHTREAYSTKRIVNDYLSSKEGHAFVNYIYSRGKELIEIKGTGAGDLGQGVVAAILHNGLEGVILSNYEGKTFTYHVADFARQYHLDQDSAMEYVLAHEFSHAAGNYSEREAEGMIKEFFLEQAGKSEGSEKARYQKLAEVAGEREQQAKYQEN